jgi:hypothetical protein
LGACPIHGRGFTDDKGAVVVAGAVAVMCAETDCSVRALQWPGKPEHSFYGLLEASADIVTALTASGDIHHEDKTKPGPHARTMRTSWPLGKLD